MCLRQLTCGQVACLEFFKVIRDLLERLRGFALSGRSLGKWLGRGRRAGLAGRLGAAAASPAARAAAAAALRGRGALSAAFRRLRPGGQSCVPL